MLSVPQPRDPKPGYVYAFRCQQYIKIGQSTDPKDRLSNVQINNPFPVKLIKAIWTEDMDVTEDQLHAKFAAYRERGEWFLLPIDAVAWLMSLEGDEARILADAVIPVLPDMPTVEMQMRELRSQGYSKAQIIKAIWKVSRGGGATYRRASEIYDAIFTLPTNYRTPIVGRPTDAKFQEELAR